MSDQEVQGEDCRIIPHGVSSVFRNERTNDFQKRNKLIYISNFDLYKNQIEVLKAVKKVRDKGFDLHISFVGGNQSTYFDKFVAAFHNIKDSDLFVSISGAVDNASLPRLISESDMFMFASRCENLPNTLLEGMASGLPILCSNMGPMPEILRDSGFYFDPNSIDSIVDSIMEVLHADPETLKRKVNQAQCIAENYSWDTCALETSDALYVAIQRYKALITK